MDCKQAQMLIQDDPDGVNHPALAAHLKSCPSCRAYAENLKQQTALLGMLRPQNAPEFDLAAAKKAKAFKSRRLRRITAACASAAAVFVLTFALFRGTGTQNFAILQESSMDTAAAYDDAAAECAPAEDANDIITFYDSLDEEAFLAESSAEESSAQDAPAEEADCPDGSCAYLAGATLTLSSKDYRQLLSEATRQGIPAKEFQNHFTISVSEENIDLLAEILEPYGSLPLSADTEIYIRKES